MNTCLAVKAEEIEKLADDKKMIVINLDQKIWDHTKSSTYYFDNRFVFLSIRFHPERSSIYLINGYVLALEIFPMANRWKEQSESNFIGSNVTLENCFAPPESRKRFNIK